MLPLTSVAAMPGAGGPLTPANCRDYALKCGNPHKSLGMQDAAHRGGPRWAAGFAIVRFTARRSVLARHLRLDPWREQLHRRRQRAAEVLGVATDPDLQDVAAGQ